MTTTLQIRQHRPYAFVISRRGLLMRGGDITAASEPG
jgi:hypothetical protein